MKQIAIALLVGLLIGWYVESLRWSNDVQARDVATAQAITANVNAVNTHLVQSRAETEQIRKEYIDYQSGAKDETDKLQRAVDDRSKRLRIAGVCSTAMQPTGTAAVRTTGGTVELDPIARQAYFDLRTGLNQQYALLTMCRAELKKRSAKDDHSTTDK